MKRITGCAIVAVVLGASSARAAEPDNRARAQELFDSALVDAMQGRFAAACPKFLASQRADPKTSTLLNLANCYDKNGQPASAWGAYREAEQSARRAGRNDWQTLAHDRAAALEPKLVRLTIHVAFEHAVEGLVVTRDDVKLERGEWNVAIPVDPGTHEIHAEAPGHRPYRARIEVKDKSQTVELPALEPGPAGTGPTPVVYLAPASWWTPTRTAGAITAAIGGATMIAGGVIGFVAKAKYEDARRACNGPVDACAPANGATTTQANDAYSLAGVATGTVIGGAALAAIGVGLIVLVPSPDASATKVTVGRSSVFVSRSW